jgi:hypothetical protein
MLICYRNKDTKSGNHYHTGKSKSKDPEKILLLKGEVALKWRSRNQKNWEEIGCSAPIEIHIPTGVIHILWAKTDILFIEQNTLDEHQGDTFRDESYLE